MNSRRLWDIFCTVIDNHGDLGVCWRLARQLADAGQTVRLWVDDASALSWMAPDTLRGSLANDQVQVQDHVHVHVQVLPWHKASDTPLLSKLPPADIWIEAFGCNLPEAFLAHAAATRPEAPAWINLEYLSAERWVPRLHKLPSPVMSGPAKGWTKHFFYPGFTPDTGGLLREPDLISRQHHFENTPQRQNWREQHAPGLQEDGVLISLFCYEPAALSQLLTQLASTPHHLMVTPGRPLAAVQKALPNLSERPKWCALPYTDQDGFDHMLWACDLNFVRGEDSLVRAIWAGKPFVWQIYPQDDNAHHAKLEAFLDWLKAPESLRRFHRVWNGVDVGELPQLDRATLTQWANTVNQARQVLLQQQSLIEQLIQHISKPCKAN